MPIFGLILLLLGGIVVASIASSSSAPAAAPSLSSKPVVPAPAPAPASVAGSSQTGGRVVSTQAPGPAPASKIPVIGSNWDRICAGMGTYFGGTILFTPEECSAFNNKINKDTAGNFGSAYSGGGAVNVNREIMYDCYYAFPTGVSWSTSRSNTGSYSYDCAVGI